MSESEWLDGDLLAEEGLFHLEMDRFTKGKQGKRKLRLFACACCRRAWHLLPEGVCREAVQLFESVADGQAHLNKLRFFRERIRRLDNILPVGPPAPGVVAAVEAVRSLVLRREGRGTCSLICRQCVRSLVRGEGMKADAYHAALKAEWAAQVLLLRDIFGNPYRPASVAASVLAWNGGMVRRMAESIYDERAFDRLPILADALEEAGCTDADILNHCRQPGEHVRGCWVVDLLLGKS